MTRSLFLVDLSYTQPLTAVDALKDAHVDFLKEQYAQGHFIVSGPKVPRTGGVILAKATDLAALNATLAKDPFHKAGIADYTVTEFTPVMCRPDFQEIVDGL